MGFRDRLHPGPRSPYTVRRLDARLDLRGRLDHRVAAHPRGICHERFGPRTTHLRRGTDDEATLALVQVRKHHLEDPRERFRGDLKATIVRRTYYSAGALTGHRIRGRDSRRQASSTQHASVFDRRMLQVYNQY